MRGEILFKVLFFKLPSDQTDNSIYRSQLTINTISIYQGQIFQFTRRYFNLPNLNLPDQLANLNLPDDISIYHASRHLFQFTSPVHRHFKCQI